MIKQLINDKTETIQKAKEKFWILWVDIIVTHIGT